MRKQMLGGMRRQFSRLVLVGLSCATLVTAGAAGANAAEAARTPADVAAPVTTLPGQLTVDRYTVFAGPDGMLWVKLHMATPWDPTPPADWFSFYVQVMLKQEGDTAAPTWVGFQTHDGVPETFAWTGTERGPDPAGYIMNDGALLFSTSIPYRGGPVEATLDTGYMETATSQFQNSRIPATLAPDAIATSDDPIHFDDEYPAYDLTTGTPVDPPVVVETTTATTVVETVTTDAPVTTEPPATTTTRDSTTTTTRTRPREVCWWCWAIVFLFVAFLLCMLWTYMKSYQWWTCWLPWFIVIFCWVPFVLAALWWWRPTWWWWPLLAWYPLVLGYARWWASRRSWWRPWMWIATCGYLVALGVVTYVVGDPEWGLLFPLYWLPWVGFYVWYRARRQPWWKPWMYLTFLAYTAWVFVWVWQLTLWWAWWLPAAFVLVGGWWFVTHGYRWREFVSPKWCWLTPFALLPFFAWWIPLWDEWWCLVIGLYLCLSLLCAVCTRIREEEWFTWWLLWFVVVFVWVPFLLAGLWFFRPNWWAWALLPWAVFVPAGAYWWARRRRWWRPWMWIATCGYLVILGVAIYVVGDPEWGLLFGVFWLPWAALYVWYRARRQPWWQPWMYLLFLAHAGWLVWWVQWLTPWWAWWFPIAFVVIAGWWHLSHGYSWSTVRRKLCWLVPWCILPWLCYMVVLECIVSG
jgi:hypothetical protein